MVVKKKLVVDWSTFTAYAFAALMDVNYDFPWQIDMDLPCGGCGARWVVVDNTSAEMVHTDACPYLKGVDIQAERTERAERTPA